MIFAFLLPPVVGLWRAATLALTYFAEGLLISSFVLSTAYALGWFHRFCWFLAEQEATKLLNNTPVTIGHLEIDLIHGRAWATNVVIHAPRRHQWKWASPVLARVGRVYVECNLVSCLLSLWFLWEELPLELYTIQASDIQVFVERRQNYFNFFLLDKHVELPDPSEFIHTGGGRGGGGEEDEDGGVGEDNDEEEGGDTIDATLTDGTTNSFDPAFVGSRTNMAETSPEHDKAQKVMDDMLRALGRAAREGSLQSALVEQRRNITNQLQALKNTKKSQAMQEGVNIVRKVSKAVVEKTQTTQQAVLPARRQLKGEKTVYGRIGRVQLCDARVFTRDHWDSSSSSHEAGSGSHPSHKGANGGASTAASSWNRPMLIHRVDVRASELCPSLAALDDRDLPVLYQPLDKYLEVIWKRVLAEIVKSNPGRLFQTAMGEVLDLWIEKDSKES